MKLSCPLCGKCLIGNFTPGVHNTGHSEMARVNWYCKDCKCNVHKSIKKDEELIWNDRFKKEGVTDVS